MWPSHPEAKKGSYPKLPLIQNDKIIDDDVTPADQALLTAQYAEKSVQFIENSAKAGKPFLLYLAHSMPHVPLFAGAKFAGKSRAGILGDVIEEIDDSVGQIVSTLEKNRALENTWIIFTSDNGPWLSYGEHAGSAGVFREGKGTCFEGGVRVPCIMSWPGKIEAGTRSNANFMTIDLLPTIASQLEIRRKGPPLDGVDVWDWIQGKPGAKNAHDGYAFYYLDNQLQAVSTADGRYKLQLPHNYQTLSGNPGGTGGIPAKYEQKRIVRPELFDLELNPAEDKNIAGVKPEIVVKLLSFADKCRQDLGDSLTKTKAKGNRPAGIVSPGDN